MRQPKRNIPFFLRDIKYLLLFQVILLSHSGYCQPAPFDKVYADSMTARLPLLPADTMKVNTLAKLASMYMLVNPVLTIQYAKEGAAIAEKINYHDGQIICLGQTAFFYAISGEWAKATIDINEAMPLCEKYNPEKVIFFYNIMYISAATKGDSLLALQYAQKALQHPAFASMHDLEKWPTYMQLGRIYEAFNQLDSAQYYAGLLAGFVKKYAQVIPDLVDNSNTLFGNIALRRKNYTEAIRYYHMAAYDFGLSRVYQVLNRRDSAIYFGLVSLKKGQIQKNPSLIQDASKLLAEEYAVSDPKEANKYLNIYIASTDTLNNKDKLKQLEQIKLNEQKNEFELQKKETATRNGYLLIALIGILVFLFIFSLFLWRNNRFKQKANQQLTTAFKELKNTQTQLIQSEKMASLGELTAGIAHEIQNPLNFVNNFSEVNKELLAEMKEEIDKGNLSEVKAIADDVIDNQEKINHHGKRADAIVKGMLQHSRSSSGTKEPTDINKLADEYLRLAYHGLRAKDKSFNAILKTDYDESIGHINIVPQDIGRVILNLLNNAFYTVQEKKRTIDNETYEPTITLSTSHTSSPSGGRGVMISVTDNGGGMADPSIISKIFQPFFTTKPTGQGTGLGLSLSYDIVKAHGGELTVKTEAGQGSEFILALPA